MMVVDCAAASRTYGSGATAVKAVDAVSFAVEAGEFVAIEGPSGAGKTTLLGLLAGLETCDAGTVTLLGHDLARLSAAERAQLRRSRIGMVFQTYGLVASLNAVENVALPLRLAGCPKDEASDRAAAALEGVDLGHATRNHVDELSGGERQRVGVARAIVIRPVLILADEPTGSLDEGHGRQIVALLADQARTTGGAVVLVTHDPASAAVAERRYRIIDGRLEPAA
jgi:putative ABC transport system ATP-binding protein